MRGFDALVKVIKDISDGEVNINVDASSNETHPVIDLHDYIMKQANNSKHNNKAKDPLYVEIEGTIQN
ncbi:hypothetical protein Y032_0006g2787 [Ancylostoma ceylanicum]|nr:hypothetical protein Y032_0006g2787 [Ancylostoma ceylanicum]